MKKFIEVTITKGQKTLIAIDSINSVIDVKKYREIHTDRGIFTVEESYEELAKRLTKEQEMICD